MSSNPLSDLLEFLCDLECRKVSYRLSHHRDDAIMVELALPGERWEVEFFPTGQVDVEVFRSQGMVELKTLALRLSED